MNIMNRSFKSFSYSFLIALILLVTATLLNGTFHNKGDKKIEFETFQNIFLQEIELLDSLSNPIISEISNEDNILDSTIQNIATSLPSNFRLSLYKSGELTYWSNNDWSFYNTYNPKLMGDGIHQYPNGWYYNKAIDINQENTLVLSFLIKEEFSYSNKYLKPCFNGPFSGIHNINLHTKQQIFSIPIHSSEGKAALYISYQTRSSNDDPSRSTLLFILVFLSLIFLYGATTRVIKAIYKSFFSQLLATLSIYVIVFFGYKYFIIPNLNLPFFDPYDLAICGFIDSLGTFFLLGICIFCFVINNNILIINSDQKKEKHIKIVYFGIYLLTLLLWMFYSYYLKIGIQDSNINPFFAKELQFNFNNILFVLSIVLTFFSFVISFQSWNLINERLHRGYSFKIILSAIILLCSIPVISYNLKLLVVVTLLFGLATTIQIKTKESDRYKYRYLILFLYTLLGAFTYVIICSQGVQERLTKHREVYAERIKNERDPNAEITFEKISTAILKDSTLTEMLSEGRKIDDYLLRSYFNGYLAKYNTTVSLYSEYDNLNIENSDQWVPANQFFNELIKKKGLPTNDTHFSSIKAMDGRINYLGRFDIKGEYQNYILIVELTSKTFDESKGYPELLLDDHIKKVYSTKSEKFSYARYHNGILVMKRGSCKYPAQLSEIEKSDTSDFFFTKSRVYDHSIVSLNKNTTIVISFLKKSWRDIIVNISYSLILFYTFGVIILLLFFNRRVPIKTHELKYKIQYSIVILVLTPLLILAIGVITYTYLQYKDQNRDDLNKKVQEVTTSLQINFGSTQELNHETASYIGQELNHLSEILWTDINFYDTNGILATSSRPEIFTQGLIGNRMNRKAYNQLKKDYINKFIHTEHIGRLEYLSIYVPFRNDKDKILGYINIPYFSRTNDLVKQITTFVITFVNLFVIILLVCLSVAIIIAQKLTSPLTMIEEKIQTMRFGESNEKIHYPANDEIGKLVQRYNEKVDELEKSAKLLAKNEREGAWREMARQIAHEIKNPLTPMKLNIQYLQKMHNSNSDRFDNYFDKVTQTLIEQIDTLSNIATSFSSFAKIPSASIQEVDLYSVINEVIHLFSSSGTIHWNREDDKPMIVLADKEQLGRLFINLIKNAQQAVLEEQESIIQIDTKSIDNYYQIVIKDNGTGIPLEIQDRLFEPYFTTKSQGTGLGLAIVKKIIETINGSIDFTTSKEDGTTFTIKIKQS
ncbi:GHKL domain-containing protein [Halosquirtibacter laminarini]|uniref:GHKL domain-containing protein n=1 Tax=Halosquirtibacter laminarini TaxID=3374600 RepID=A0AC61NNP3_9BACT|nr:GHKL domain-containing protein [Prolixibacteraceae bacterium]